MEESFPQTRQKGEKTMPYKTYNWCKWHKAWVEHDPEGKVANECQLFKKLEEEQKPEIQG